MPFESLSISDDFWKSVSAIYERGAERGRTHLYSRRVYGLIAVVSKILDITEEKVSSWVTSLTHWPISDKSFDHLPGRDVMGAFLYKCRLVTADTHKMESSSRVWVWEDVSTEDGAKKKVYATPYEDIESELRVIHAYIKSNKQILQEGYEILEHHRWAWGVLRFFGHTGTIPYSRVLEWQRQRQHKARLNIIASQEFENWKNKPGKINKNRLQPPSSIFSAMSGIRIDEVWAGALSSGRYITDGVISFDSEHLTPPTYRATLLKQQGEQQVADSRVASLWEEVVACQDCKVNPIGVIHFSNDRLSGNAAAYAHPLYFSAQAQYGLVDSRKVYWCAKRVGARQLDDLWFAHSSINRFERTPAQKELLKGISNIPNLTGILMAFKGKEPVFMIRALTPFGFHKHRGDIMSAFSKARKYCIEL